jgi:predicted metal-dependent enzyme (double-stranded beta helix superfamily)
LSKRNKGEAKKNKGAKLAYRPIGLVSGLVAGSLSGIVFKQVWKLVAKEEEAPSALQSEYRMREVVLAAAIQGAIFAATKAAVDRAGAQGFKQVTGAWPGD